MEITKEQKESIEYLEKYTKWETYGERNLEKDIITVLELLRDLYNDNIRYEKELHYTLKYSISKEKIKDKIKKLSEIKGDFATYIATSERIKALSELLESEEKMKKSELKIGDILVLRNVDLRKLGKINRVETLTGNLVNLLSYYQDNLLYDDSVGHDRLDVVKVYRLIQERKADEILKLESE